MNLYQTKHEVPDSFDWDNFVNEKQRIKKNTETGRSCKNVLEAFQTVYGKDKCKCSSQIDKTDDFILEVGMFVKVHVSEVTKRGIRMESPFIKGEIINKDNMTAFPQFMSYLALNNNEIIGYVKEIKTGKVYIDVLDAYYRLWVNQIQTENIEKEIPILVTDLKLTNGGYLGDTEITTLTQLTGHKHVCTCFIPGSQIVRNIEQDFDSWIGEDVEVLPQKFTLFSTQYARRDNCLLCSRKQLLLYKEAEYIEHMYATRQLVEKVNGELDNEELREYEGTVTGVINTANKKGVFIELKDKYITGMLPRKAYQLTSYGVGDIVYVKIAEFEVMNPNKPFIRNKNGNIKYCNVRVVFSE